MVGSDRPEPRLGFAPEPIREACEAIDAFRAYVGTRVDAARAAADAGRGLDLLATLVDANEAERLTTGELTATFVHLLFAGHETTTNLIAIGMLYSSAAPRPVERALRRPGRSRSGRGRGAPAVSSAPSRRSTASPSRTSSSPGPRAGGTEVIGLLGSANRDPEALERPDELDLRRDPGVGHLTWVPSATSASARRWRGSRPPSS